MSATSRMGSGTPTFEDTLADTDELIGRLRGWRLAAEAWAAVNAELESLGDALAARDVHGARLSLSRIELAGPVLGAPPISPTASVRDSADPVAMPRVVNETVERVGAAITRSRAKGRTRDDA
ncbi:hypothetical protein GCM10029978_112770 [Actinoallomurus acanthiterrae]